MARDLGIIIPTCNRSAQLLRCLQALVRQVSPRLGNVYVVNDGAEPPPSEIVTLALARHLVVLSGPGHGPTLARNLGIQQASEEWLAFLDDDAVPRVGWVASLLELFDRFPRVTAQLGRILWSGREARPETAALQEWHRTFIPQIRQKIYDHRHAMFQSDRFRHALATALEGSIPEGLPGLSTHLSGGNMAIRREFFQAHGPFDARFPTQADRELAWRIVSQRQVIAYNPAMEVEHDHAASMRRALGRIWFAAPYERRLTQLYPAAHAAECGAMRAGMDGGARPVHYRADERAYLLLRAAVRGLAWRWPHRPSRVRWV